MRSMTTIAAALLIGAPIVATGTPARADNSDLMGQAQGVAPQALFERFEPSVAYQRYFLDG